ncbi:MAG: bifunctional phosphoribosylaminoimidazolecarboxamide formyltransferase/IMP cyclohydrolase [Defluviitaleaceae bacterium]|nr:bifunctional phosphoribosylaminoimidazolecarboxamide formyltransferase/IMP cyclohydrolase [Defluviitaleaceae bacterium]
MKKYALLSVSDKAGIVDFAYGLVKNGFEIVSTGSTYQTIVDEGIAAIEVSNITGFPECLDGRLKTLHPHIHGGILARRDLDHHMDFLAEKGIGTIDLVCVNLYPFKETVLKTDNLSEIIENIDIGGPAMIRSAAKNYASVAVVVDKSDYADILQDLGMGTLSQEYRFRLAAKAFAHTAAYDALIAGYLSEAGQMPKFPEKFTVTYEKIQEMRYGENPHQEAAFYREILAAPPDLVNAKQIHGKELSFNNINDAHGAVELTRELDAPAAIVAVKHATPCGVGTGANLLEAWEKAYSADPLSIFGGIIAANCEIDADVAKEIDKIFVEIVIAPSFSQEALSILQAKKNIRLMILDIQAKAAKDKEITKFDFKKVSGGLLVQDIDSKQISLPQCVTKKQPTDKELNDMLFAWKLAKHIKSNGIAIAKSGQSLGLAGGQVNRIWSTKQAIDHAKEFLGDDVLKGAVLASDAFFPFADCVEEAHKAGITAIIQPGGSQNDAASIEACDKYGIAMMFTGLRHFRH